MMRAMLLIAVLGCSRKRAPSRDDAPVAAPPNWTVHVQAGWFSEGRSRLMRLDPGPDEASQEGEGWRFESSVGADPPRRVWVSSFEIDRLETTVDDYLRCVDARVCGAPTMREIVGPHATTWPIEGPLPVMVSHREATRYCEFRRMRLPTKAEWEKAARGTDDRMFAWGDDPPNCTRSSSRPHDLEAMIECDGPGLRPVGQLPLGASPYGLLDMEDNAPEWVTDFRDVWRPRPGEPRYRRDVRGDYVVLSLDWSSQRFHWPDSVIDPKGPEVGVTSPHADEQLHVAMGGWVHPGINPDIGVLEFVAGKAGLTQAGIRCARSVPGPPPPTLQVPQPDELTHPFREPGYNRP
jgi:formylglycine-generating enzyme required for sulfatase activity